MAIFLDTGNVQEVEKYMKMGVIRGVTTNPTILLKDGVKGGKEEIKEISIQIAKLIYPYPLSVEVTSNDYREMIVEAEEYSKWAENINVKITIHGPNGEMDNLVVIHELATKYKIQINATAMMSAQQCLLAAMSGATYVSLFGGRVNNMGYNCSLEIKKLRTVLDSLELKAKIIIGSTREILNVMEWLEAGADIVTVVPDILKGMIIHPYTKETVQMFLKDAAETNKRS
ncbi:MAG: transaldolase [Acidobacteria bacterium]|nr:transaldolase [Acidobacteriota bacterium]MDP6641582.1 transaldolase family protein [Nitrososphaerales archaeon]|tara:strand:- start:78 stop:764 length:687 start_codon:yes stop_codon:yes gene_type:complete